VVFVATNCSIGKIMMIFTGDLSALKKMPINFPVPTTNRQTQNLSLALAKKVLDQDQLILSQRTAMI
jgi:hypothetical protein